MFSYKNFKMDRYTIFTDENPNYKSSQFADNHMISTGTALIPNKNNNADNFNNYFIFDLGIFDISNNSLRFFKIKLD